MLAEPDKTPPAPFAALPPEARQALAGALRALAAFEDRPPPYCLAAGHVWLGMLGRLLAGLPEAALADTVAQYAAHGPAGGFGRAFEIAGRARRHPHPRGPLPRRQLLGLALAMRRRLGRSERPTLTGLGLTAANLAQILSRGRLRFPPLAGSLALRRFAPVRLDALEGAEQRLLREWLLAWLDADCLEAWGPDLLRVWSQLILLTALVGWYREAVRLLEPERAGAPLARALELVGAEYVHHESFHQVFLHHPATLHLLERSARQPRYPHMMLLE